MCALRFSQKIVDYVKILKRYKFIPLHIHFSTLDSTTQHSRFIYSLFSRVYFFTLPILVILHKKFFLCSIFLLVRLSSIYLFFSRRYVCGFWYFYFEKKVLNDISTSTSKIDETNKIAYTRETYIHKILFIDYLFFVDFLWSLFQSSLHIYFFCFYRMTVYRKNAIFSNTLLW